MRRGENSAWSALSLPVQRRGSEKPDCPDHGDEIELRHILMRNLTRKLTWRQMLKSSRNTARGRGAAEQALTM